MQKRVVVSLVCVGCAALLAVTVAQSRPAAGKTINIGGIYDKSGPTVVAQAPVLHALEAYFKYTNDNGGVNGDKINFIEKDDSYSPAKELEAAKSLVNDDKVVLVAGLGTSSGFASVLPILTSAKVPGFMAQATVKDASDPFQPYIFEGNCNYSDQADIALGYEMTKLHLKNLKGKKVGVASIDSASGQEWTANLTRRVQGLGGSVVVEAMPASIISADVQVQAFQSAKVDFILIGHAAPGGIALLKSMAKYGMQKTPVSGHFGVANENVFLQAPYEMSKNFAAVNCVTPPGLAKTAKGKLATAMGKKYGYPDSEISQANWSLGWTEGAVIVQGLKNANGNYTGAGVKAGLEKIKTLDVGGLAPNVGFSPKCHMLIRQLRPYTYNYQTKSLQPIGSYTQWAKFNTNYYAAPGTCGKK